MMAGCLHEATPEKEPRLREEMEPASDWPKKGKEADASVHAVSRSGKSWEGNDPRPR